MLKINHYFDPQTFTVTYLVFHIETKSAVLIDPVLDYEPQASTVSFESYDKLVADIESLDLSIKYVLETHVHADHLTSSVYLKEKFPGAKTVISREITQVQKVFSQIYNYDIPCDGSEFDLLVDEGNTIELDGFSVDVIATPGHTPACVTYKIDNHLFTGDALFMPDMGTGRCDFPKGDAEKLYDSVQKIYAFPDDTIIHVGHDYAPGGREYKFTTTVAEQKEKNIQLTSTTTKSEFVSFRKQRDETLKAPRLLLQSIQVNMVAGKLPVRESNQTHYLKIPLQIERS